MDPSAPEEVVVPVLEPVSPFTAEDLRVLRDALGPARSVEPAHREAMREAARKTAAMAARLRACVDAAEARPLDGAGVDLPVAADRG